MKINSAHSEIRREPRFSAKQKQVLDACLRQDPHSEILGIDGNMRPVVACQVGIPRQRRIWAILRNGDPTDVKWEDDPNAPDAATLVTTESDPSQWLAEPWTSKTRGRK